MSQENFESSEEYMARYGVGCHRCAHARWSAVRNDTRFFEGCGKDPGVTPQPPAPEGKRRYAMHSFLNGTEEWNLTEAITEDEVVNMLEAWNSAPGFAARAFSEAEITLAADGQWEAYDEEDRCHIVPDSVVDALCGMPALPVACPQYEARRGEDADEGWRMEIPSPLEADIEKWEQGQAHWSVSNSVIRGFKKNAVQRASKENADRDDGAGDQVQGETVPMQPEPTMHVPVA